MNLIEVKQGWQNAWFTPWFRHRLMVGMILLVAILLLLPPFYHVIQRRQGLVLHDAILEAIPAHNVSTILFIVMWTFTGYCVYRAAQTPAMFLAYLWSFIFMTTLRCLTIKWVPLDPPAGLIGLVDPVSNFFYGSEGFVTKDLFFSGHTSSMFLLYLTVPGKNDKKLALVITAIVAVLLLVQHVHYTLDILGGLLFSWFSYFLAKRSILR